MDSVQTLSSTPINAGLANGQILANLATVTRSTVPPVFTHYNVVPVIDVYGNVDGQKYTPRHSICRNELENATAYFFVWLRCSSLHGQRCCFFPPSQTKKFIDFLPVDST